MKCSCFHTTLDVDLDRHEQGVFSCLFDSSNLFADFFLDIDFITKAVLLNIFGLAVA